MVVDGKTLDRKCFVVLLSRGSIEFVICASSVCIGEG